MSEKVVAFTGESMSAQRVVDFLQSQIDGGDGIAIIAAVHTGPDMNGDVVSAWSTCKSGEMAHMLIALDHDIRKQLITGD